MKQPQKSEKEVNEAIVGKWEARMTSAKANQQPLFTAYERWFDDFYAKWKKQTAPWRSKVFDPKLASKAVGTIAKLSLAEPRANIIPNDSHDFIKAESNEALLDFNLKNPDFDQPLFLKSVSINTDAVVTGTGWAMVPWTTKKKTFYTRRINGKVSSTDEKKIEKMIGYNDLIPWSTFRVFIDPAAQSVQGASYIIAQDFKGLEQARQIGKEMGWKLPSTFEERGGEILAGEKSRNRLLTDMGVSEYSKKGNVEIWYCYDMVKKERCIILNGNHLALAEPMMDWHGKAPLVPFYFQPRAFSPFGVGLFERAERMGSANNDLMNHFFDQLSLSLNGVMMRDESTTISTYDMRPGGEIVYSTGGEKPEFAAIPQPDLQGFQIARQMMSESIEENTISQYELGLPRSSSDQTKGTATGVLAIQQAASELVRFFETSIANAWQQVFEIWLSNNLQYMDREVIVRVLGRNGYFPKSIKPDDIIGYGSFDVEVDVDSIRPKSKEANAQLALAYIDKQLQIAQLAAALGNPININFYEMSVQTAKAFDQDQFERILEPMPAPKDTPLAENDLFLMGKSTPVFEQDDHEAHIEKHSELLEDPQVDSDIREKVQKHVEEHRQIAGMIREAKLVQENEQLRQQAAQTAKDAGMPYPGMAQDQVSRMFMQPQFNQGSQNVQVPSTQPQENSQEAGI